MPLVWSSIAVDSLGTKRWSVKIPTNHECSIESGRLVIVVPNSPCWDTWRSFVWGMRFIGPKSHHHGSTYMKKKHSGYGRGVLDYYKTFHSSTPQASGMSVLLSPSQPWTSLNAWQASERTTECGRPNWLVTQRPGRPVELVGFVGSCHPSVPLSVEVETV